MLDATAITRLHRPARTALIALLVALVLPVAGLVWDLRLRSTADELAATRERLVALRERLGDHAAHSAGPLALAENLVGRQVLADQFLVLGRYQQWCGGLNVQRLQQQFSGPSLATIDALLDIVATAERRVRVATGWSRLWLLAGLAAAVVPAGVAVLAIRRLQRRIARIVPETASGSSSSAARRARIATMPPSVSSATPVTQLAAIRPRTSAAGFIATPLSQPMGRLRGRVLVVEDNPINQRVTQRQLTELGIDAEVVDDGETALRRLAGERWDAVLMDLQLPGIDGLIATSRWRAQEISEGRRRLPVVAITANASDSDRSACFAAGMDGYLAKPARLDDLYQALTRWLSGQPVPTSVTPSPVIAPSPIIAAPAAEHQLQQLHDSAMWAKLRSETAATDPRMLEELMKDLRAQVPQQLSALSAALSATDWEALRAIAHRLKGSAGMLGLPRLSIAARDVELAARNEHEVADVRLGDLRLAITETFADPAVAALG